MKRKSGCPNSLKWIAPAIALLSFLFSASAFANNPIPTVVGPPVPQAVVPGSGAFTLMVYGANFVSGAVVNWNRSPRSTTFVSARELQAQILASDVATATAGYITVTNPPPGGRVSSSSFAIVEVHIPMATVVVKRPNVYLRDIGAQKLALSDFNNDGILDFAAAYGSSEIKVLLGNGDGTFGHGSIAAHGYDGSDAAAIASGDLNNDGNEDLVFGANPNPPPYYLRTSMGNGDGTFRKGSRFGNLPTDALGLTTGDFNRDGNLDVASVTAPSDLDVFLGQGDGSFTHWVDYDQFGGTPGEVLLADFNGDGVLDLAVAADGVYILVGHGDGTFQKPRKVIASKHAECSPFGTNLFVSDFNGDGRADLAYCESGYPANRGKVWVALGNGDGTFKTPISLTVPAYEGNFSFAVGDFNSDGKTDVIANYFTSSEQNRTETDLFLGNGDGTFQKKKIVILPGEPFYNAENGIAAADFNSDGLLDFIVKEPGEFDVFVQK